MKKYLFILIVTIAFLSCKKESAKSCWQIIDCTGSALQSECDKTESEIQGYVNSISTPGCQKTYKKQ
jgi:hypothetical protein